MKYLKLFFIINIIFYLVKSEEIDELHYNKIDYFLIEEIKTYKLNIPINETNNYIMIEVKGNYSNINYAISYYNDYSKSRRIQLSQSINGISKLYISPNQIQTDNIYFDLECSNYSNSFCSGIIYNKFFPKIKLFEGEQLNYYVSENNTIMEFVLNSYNLISNVWAKGQLNISTELNGDYDRKVNDNYYIVIKGEIKETEFIVRGCPGDYINVGFFGYSKDQESDNNEYEYNSKIIVNDAPITGFLKRNILEKLCFAIKVDNNTVIGNNNYIFGNGKIMTKIAYFSEEYINSSREIKGKILPSGMIFNEISPNEIEKKRICISFPDSNTFPQYNNINEIVFTYQITTGSSNENHYNLYEPQINGEFYSRAIIPQERVAFLGKINSNFKEMNFILNIFKGFPKMTIIECNNYPFCSLDDDNLKKGVSPRNINGFSSYTYHKGNNDEYFSSISKNQLLLVVECQNSDNEKYFNQNCQFGTLIYKDQDKIELIEDQYFNQFTQKDQEHIYKINISKESNIQVIFIDVITFMGEIEISTNFAKNIKFTQNISINKISINIEFNNNSKEFKDLIFSVRGITNTYYTILVNYARKNVEDSLITNNLQTGMSYLVTIDPSQNNKNQNNKIIKIFNDRKSEQIPFLISFFALNCKIKVWQVYTNKENNKLLYKELETNDFFSHDIIDILDKERYENEQYEYRINIIEDDISQYNGKLCKIYTSAIEISENHDEFTRDIIIPDNTIQQIIFKENIKHVSFGYIHVDFKNDLIIKFNLKQKALYKILIYYENIKRKKEEELTSNRALFLNHQEWMEICPNKDKVCYIQLDITLEQLIDNDESILEFSIESIETNTVAYIPKNLYKVDYAQYNIQKYLYTELGENEEGFIVLNFFRGGGVLLARIVEENKNEEGSGKKWRGKYNLPNKSNSMEMNIFNNKIIFSTENYNCQNGCYLLISIFSDIGGDIRPINRNYPFSIIVYSYPKYLNPELPVVKIPEGEFINGNVQVSSPNENFYQFYSISFNSDAKLVSIDFQSDSVGLFLNVGLTRPTFNNFHFQFCPKGEKNIYYLSKDEILAKGEQLGYIFTNGLKDVNLTIGLWENISESIYSAPFSLNIRLENDTENDIYIINSNQKFLSKNKKIENENKYRCLYVIKYDDISLYESFLIYPIGKNKSAYFDIYAKYVEPIYFETDFKNKLKDLIPTKDSHDFSNHILEKDYLLINRDLEKNNKYLLISVETHTETIIEFLTSFSSYENAISPNQISSQLFMVYTNDYFYLNLPLNENIIVNLKCVEGSGEISWENSPKNINYLNGKEDGLSLISEESATLVIFSKDYLHSSIAFIFYANYEKRNDNINFDKLILNSSNNYVYLKTKFQIKYYALLNLSEFCLNDYYEIFFYINTIESNNESILNYYDDNDPFEIKAFILNDNEIYSIKSNKQNTINSDKKTIGIYDPGLRAGFLKITKNFIEQKDIQNNEKIYLYLEINKNEKGENIKYNRIGLETGVTKNNPEIPVSDSSYQFGCFNINENERKYRLRINNKLKYMILEFSCSNNNVKLKIEGKGNELNFKDEKFGKKKYLFQRKGEEKYVILVITRDNNKKDKSEYFMFKYSYSDEIKDKYSISNTVLDVRRIEIGNVTYADYNIKFSPIEDYQKYNITYIVKFEGLKRNMEDTSIKIPKNEYICLTEERKIVKEYFNPSIENDNLINLHIHNIDLLYSYIQIIAQIRNRDAIEYLSYKIFDLNNLDNNNDEEDDDDDNKIILIIILSIFIAIIFIVLAIYFLFYKPRKKDLFEKVNKISFKKDDDDRNFNNNCLLTGDKIPLTDE